MNSIKTLELETGGGTTQPDSGEGAAVASTQPVIGNQPNTEPSSPKAGADFILPLMILGLIVVKWWFSCKRS